MGILPHSVSPPYVHPPARDRWHIACDPLDMRKRGRRPRIGIHTHRGGAGVELSVAYQGGTRYDVLTDRHMVVTDQPVEDGGADAGMSPVELFVGSVASCVGYFVGQFCARHDISREGLRVEAEWTMAEEPHRVGQVQLAIRLPHRVTPELKERLLKVAHGCTVHQSIVVPAQISIDLNTIIMGRRRLISQKANHDGLQQHGWERC